MSIYNYANSQYTYDDTSYDPDSFLWSIPEGKETDYNAQGIYTKDIPNLYKTLADKGPSQQIAPGNALPGSGTWEGITLNQNYPPSEQQAPVWNIPENFTDAAHMGAALGSRQGLSIKDVKKYWPSYQVDPMATGYSLLNLNSPNWWSNPNLAAVMPDTGNDFTEMLGAAMQIASIGSGLAGFGGASLFGDLLGSFGFGDLGGLGNLFGGGDSLGGLGDFFGGGGGSEFSGGFLDNPEIFVGGDPGMSIFDPNNGMIPIDQFDWSSFNNQGQGGDNSYELSGRTIPEGVNPSDWAQGYTESLSPNTQYLQDLTNLQKTPQFTLDQVTPEASDFGSGADWVEPGWDGNSPKLPSGAGEGAVNSPTGPSITDRIKNMSMKDYMKLGQGLYSGVSNLQRSGDMKNLLDEYSGRVDPFGSQRPQYQRRLADLFTPEGMNRAFETYMAGPGATAMEQMARRDAAQGRRSQAGSLRARLQQNFMSNLNNEKSLLSNLSGAQFGPGSVASLASSLGPRTSDAGAWMPMFGALGSIFNNGSSNQSQDPLSTLLSLFS